MCACMRACVCVSVCRLFWQYTQSHQTKDTIVLSVEFAAKTKRHFSLKCLFLKFMCSDSLLHVCLRVMHTNMFVAHAYMHRPYNMQDKAGQ